MKAIIVEPNEEPREIEIENNLEVLQEAVDGYIETVAIDKGVVLIVNEDGKLLGLPPNV